MKNIQTNKNVIISAFVLHVFGGLGITAGAHRLWAHRAYKARLPVRIFLMIANCVALQVFSLALSFDDRFYDKKHVKLIDKITFCTRLKSSAFRLLKIYF